MKSAWLPSNFQQLILAVFVSSILFSCSQNQDESFSLPDTVDFNYHIRPILSQNCFLCHGPDPSSREAELRLDTYEGATAASDGGKVITPHKAAKSLLIKRITSNDPDFQMPPPEAKKNLTKKEIALIEKWINQGAEWKEHWAYIKPEIIPNPSIELKRIHENIDFYVDRQLEFQQLKTSGIAEPHQLIRRVAYLTTGLPPTIDELRRFSESSEQKYKEMVDYYLGSPHYGEQWARHWMDLVRYAEHRGHEFDFTINGAFYYRDYLIRAFNNDLPYDQFVKEHLAGDMLESPRLHPQEGYNESIIATAYANLGEGKHSPVSIKEEESTRIDNMIDVTSKTFQALTVSCARCHDHKFDPIPTSDYYAMYGMFESTRIGPTSLTNTNQALKASEEILELKLKAKDLTANQLLRNTTALSIVESNNLKGFIKSQKAKIRNSQFELIGDFTQGQWNGWKADGIAFGNLPSNNRLAFDSDKRKIEIIPPSASSRNISKGILGTIRSPNFILEHDTIGIYARGRNSTARIVVDNFQLIQNPLYGSLLQKIDNAEFSLYTLDVSRLKGHKAYIEILPGSYDRHQYQLDSSSYFEVQYVFAINDKNTLEEIQKSIEKKSMAISIPEQHKAITAWNQDKASQRDIDIVNTALTNNIIDLPTSKLIKLLAKKIETNTDLHQQTPKIHTMSEGDAVMSPVFIRGSYKQLDIEKVAHGFLSAPQVNTPLFPQEGSGRMAWAEAVLHPDNPLTSRVIVNRIWHHIFGRGIVETMDNFGLQGKLPTHPDLLDYLAVRFMEEGWSIKHLIKEILMTATFRKSTIPIKESASKDPENLFLHHFPIRRLEAESIRDAILASSQQLDTTMYGEPVPIHLTDFMTGRGRPDISGPLDGDGRRSIYTSIRRNFLPPMMLTFDMPIPFSTFGKRNTTNVPAQSLALMNDPFVHQQAGKWAENLVADETSNINDRIEKVYLIAFGRIPSELEIKEAQQLLADLSGSELSDQETQNDLELWTHFCHSIYNLKEFIHLM